MFLIVNITQRIITIEFLASFIREFAYVYIEVRSVVLPHMYRVYHSTSTVVSMDEP